MNALEATSGNFSVGLKHESETKSELKKQFEHGHRTEAEEAFQGPKFDPPVYRRRYAAVCELVKKHQAKKVLDFGCAEAKLVKVLTSQEQLTHLEEVVGVDIDRELLERNEFRIKPLISDYLRPRSHPFKVSLYQGSVAEADERFVDFDVIACIELIEHLEPEALHLMPETVFGQLSPKVAIVTTPNVEFNVLFPNLQGFRHYDHKFEWTRAEFQEWANSQASRYNYFVTFDGIASGPVGTEHLGCCSQVAVFERISVSPNASKVQQPYNLVAEVEYPFRVDTRTEEDKILQEVEYILWLLSSQKEEEEENSSSNSTLNNEDNLDGHLGEEHTEDKYSRDTIGAENNEARVYPLEKLLSFSCLCNVCQDINRLRDVLQDSSLYQLTEDGLGVLWQQSSPCWSSDENDTNWDDCDDPLNSKESELDKPENWDDDISSGVCGAGEVNRINPAISFTKQLCWNDSNNCAKLWNGKDWSELDDEITEENIDEEFDSNLNYWDNKVVKQESDASHSNDSDDGITDDLFWISLES